MKRLKNHVPAVVFILAAAFLMTVTSVSSERDGRVYAAGNIINSAVSYAAEPLSGAGSGISSFITGIVNLKKNQLENESLRQQVADLETELAESRLTELEYQDMKALEKSLEYADYDDEYSRVTAKVTASNGADIFDIFMINAGTEKGIKVNDIVVSAEGLTGRVSDTGKGWSKVAGVIDPSVSVSFTVLSNPSVTGVASGDGQGGITGYIFDDTDQIKKGDILVTSGLGFYPEGIRIAEVDSAEINRNTMKKDITAHTDVDFRSLRLVTVLTKQ